MTASRQLSPETIQQYQQNGFCRVESIISPAEVSRYHAAAMAVSARKNMGGNIFQQIVNIWLEDNTLKELTLHPAVTAAAQQLAGTPLRLWHDHILIKHPVNSAPTQFHQDQPYWPHATSTQPISCWIALCDVPSERGCMSFIPGSHRRTSLTAQDLSDAGSLFGMCPEMRWEPRVTVPLRAGDCTFHHGRCAHMATPNLTEEPRVAHVVIFMDQSTTYAKRPHIVTDPLNLEPGAALDGDLFPVVPLSP